MSISSAIRKNSIVATINNTVMKNNEISNLTEEQLITNTVNALWYLHIAHEHAYIHQPPKSSRAAKWHRQPAEVDNRFIDYGTPDPTCSNTTPLPSTKNYHMTIAEHLVHKLVHQIQQFMTPTDHESIDFSVDHSRKIDYVYAPLQNASVNVHSQKLHKPSSMKVSTNTYCGLYGSGSAQLTTSSKPNTVDNRLLFLFEHYAENFSQRALAKASSPSITLPIPVDHMNILKDSFISKTLLKQLASKITTPELFSPLIHDHIDKYKKHQYHTTYDNVISCLHDLKTICVEMYKTSGDTSVKINTHTHLPVQTLHETSTADIGSNVTFDKHTIRRFVDFISETEQLYVQARLCHLDEMVSERPYYHDIEHYISINTNEDMYYKYDDYDEGFIDNKLSADKLCQEYKAVGGSELVRMIVMRFVALFNFYNNTSKTIFSEYFLMNEPYESHNREFKSEINRLCTFMSQMSENDLRCVFSPIAFSRFMFIKNNLTNGSERQLKRSAVHKFLKTVVDDICITNTHRDIVKFMNSSRCVANISENNKWFAGCFCERVLEWYRAELMSRIMCTKVLEKETVD